MYAFWCKSVQGKTFLQYTTLSFWFFCSDFHVVARTLKCPIRVGTEQLASTIAQWRILRIENAVLHAEYALRISNVFYILFIFANFNGCIIIYLSYT